MGGEIHIVKAVVTLPVATWMTGTDSPDPKSDSSSTHPVLVLYLDVEYEGGPLGQLTASVAAWVASSIQQRKVHGSNEAPYSVHHFSVHTHVLQEGILLAVAVLVQDPLTPFAGSAAAGTACKLLQLQSPHLQN